MTDLREAVELLLSEKPGLKQTLQDILEVDAQQDTWEFQDIPADSGEFGEIVSTGIVEDTGDGYAIVDRTAVKTALGQDSQTKNSSSQQRLSTDRLDLSVPNWETVTIHPHWWLLAGTLLLIVLTRVLNFFRVFRKGDVVLAANDPYFVRYKLNQHLDGPETVLNIGTILFDSDSLFQAIIWWVTELFGGSVYAGGVVLAVYPVVAAVLAGVLVYSIVRRLTQDWRIAIASVAVLAVLPQHAFRTGLGFSDNDAFSYVWIALTVLALVSRTRVEDVDWRDWQLWRTGITLGIGVAGYTLSWVGSPIGMIPLGVYAGGLVLSSLRAGQSPITDTAHLIYGLLIATLIVAVTQILFAWTGFSALAVVGGLSAGTIGISIAGEVFYRWDVSHRGFAAVALIASIVCIIFLRQLPVFSSLMQRGVAYFERTGQLQIAEASPLVKQSPIIEMITSLGPLFIIALPVLLLLSWQVYRSHHPRWLVLVVYSWYFLILTVFIQIRFAGELSLFLAVLSGVALTYVAARTEVIQPLRLFIDEYVTPPQNLANIITHRDKIKYLIAIFILFGGLNVIQTGIVVNKNMTDESEHDAAQWMDTYESEQGWTYPENYVLSGWGRNRMYNYFVNGDEEHPQSLWYGYARDNYGDFLISTAPRVWYERLQQRGTGFIVTTRSNQQLADVQGNGPRERTDETNPTAGKNTDLADSNRPRATMQKRLHEQLTSGTETTAGLAHYRALYTSQDGSVKVFTLVPGSTINMTGPIDQEITVSTTVDIEGTKFTYNRYIKPTNSGHYTVTVPYPGNYTIHNSTVFISEQDVWNGTQVYMKIE